MRSFGELLVTFTERAGISDAELARSIGVQRQTIFRWKEGLVARPRYREDILRIADKLRLTPAERDELLLAGGFPPESAAVAEPAPPAHNGAEPVIGPVTEPVTGPAAEPIAGPVAAAEPPSHASDPAQQAPVPPAPAPRPPRLIPHPGLLLGVTVAVMLGVALAGYLLASRFWPQPAVAPTAAAPATSVPAAVTLAAPTTAPVAAAPEPTIVPAAPGEKLLLVSPFVGYTSADLRFNVAGRIEEALNREMRDAQLPHVRVAVLGFPVAAQPQAQAWLDRTNAAALIWGEYDAGRVRATVTVSTTNPGGGSADNVTDWTNPVDSPQKLAVVINDAVPNAARMLALYALGRLYHQDNNPAAALNAFQRALALQPQDKEMTAPLQFYIGTLLPKVKGLTVPVLTEAIVHLDQALALEPNWENVRYNRGTIYLGRALLSADPAAERADLDAAIADLTSVIDRQPNRVDPLLNRGIAYYQRRGDNDLPAAVADFTKAISLRPADARGYYHRGLAYIRMADPAWEADMRKAEQLQPEDPSIQNGLCWGYGLAAEPAKALPACDRAANTDPTGRTLNGGALDGRALAYAQLGRYAEAAADLQHYLEWVRATYPDLTAKYRGPEIEQWIAALERGQNPLTEEVRKSLR